MREAVLASNAAAPPIAPATCPVIYMLTVPTWEAPQVLGVLGDLVDIKEWLWTPRAIYARLMPIQMQILLVCLVMRTIQILPAPRVGLDSSSLLQIVLSFGNPSYRQRRLYPRWKPK